LVSACASDAPLDTLDPQGPEARTIDKLVDPVFLAAGVVFVLVEGAIIYLVWRYRAKPNPDVPDWDPEFDDPEDAPDESLPPQNHGDLKLELGWTVLPTLLLAAVSVGTVITLFDLADQPADAVEVEVVGQQWWWSFEYDVDGDGEPDFSSPNEMVIPAGTPVNVDITSLDVIHSFWIPALNGKRDAVPGRSSPLTLEADDPGTYWGQCTEFCGLSHANMRMRVIALTPDDYQAWLDNQVEEAEADLLTGVAAEGVETFTSQCAQCHLVRGVNTDDYAGADTVSGTAPELTHLMSRSTFAGSIFRLYTDADDPDLAERYLSLAEEQGTFNRAQLEEWIRNPTAEKPMYAGEDDGPPFRGMPDLNLTEDQIDQLVAFLSTLK
jgi:cytochrome c oxidase subunit 2